MKDGGLDRDVTHHQSLVEQNIASMISGWANATSTVVKCADSIITTACLLADKTLAEEERRAQTVSYSGPTPDPTTMLREQRIYDETFR